MKSMLVLIVCALVLGLSTEYHHRLKEKKSHLKYKHTNGLRLKS